MVFSHHFIFLSLSVAMCGLGLGGFVASLREFKKKDLATVSLRLALFFPLSIVIPFKVTFLLSHPFLLSLSFLPPFVLTGLFVSLAFRLFHPFSGSLYFSDLTGASIGALAIGLLLALFSPINVIFLFSFLILLATILLLRKPFPVIFQALLVLFLVLNRGHRLLDIPYQHIPESKDTKMLIKVLKDEKTGAVIEKTYWNPSFRTDVVYKAAFPHTREVFVDGGAPTLLLRFGGDLDSLSWLKSSLSFFPMLVAEKGEMLSIGPGGGADILLGLIAGFERIEAVEVNPDMLKILRAYDEFSGRIIENEKVEFSIGEGRNYLKRTDKSYDLIFLALAQTATSAKTGLPLVESYLHTRDAYVDYLFHLTAKGVVAFICDQGLFLQRTVFNALLALRETGIGLAEAKNHIIIVSNPSVDSPYRHLLLLRKAPFSRKQAEDIRQMAEARGFVPGWLPYIHERMAVSFSSPEEMTEVVNEIRARRGIDIGFTTDDRPFFYDLLPGVPFFLYCLCIATLLISLGVVFLRKNRRLLVFGPYFMLLGAGFMLVEVSLIQKFLFFLGYPLTTFSVILFSLLLGCGVGGFLVQKMENPFRKVPKVLLGLSLLILVIFLGLERLFLLAFSLSDTLRAAVSFAILMPLGILLGMPFPAGMREMGRVSQRDIGLMWGVNGLMSVCGSSLCIIISKSFGFRYSLLSGLLVYVAVLLLSLKLSKR